MNFPVKEVQLSTGEIVGVTFNTTTLCLIEGAGGGNLKDLADYLANGGIRGLVSIIRFMLEGWRVRVKKDRAEFTMLEAEEVVDLLGGIGEAAKVIRSLSDGSMPDEAKEKARNEIDAAVNETAAAMAGKPVDPLAV